MGIAGANSRVIVTEMPRRGWEGICALTLIISVMNVLYIVSLHVPPPSHSCRFLLLLYKHPGHHLPCPTLFSVRTQATLKGSPR